MNEATHSSPTLGFCQLDSLRSQRRPSSLKEFFMADLLLSGRDSIAALKKWSLCCSVYIVFYFENVFNDQQSVPARASLWWHSIVFISCHINCPDKVQGGFVTASTMSTADTWNRAWRFPLVHSIIIDNKNSGSRTFLAIFIWGMMYETEKSPFWTMSCWHEENYLFQIK